MPGVWSECLAFWGGMEVSAGTFFDDFPIFFVKQKLQIKAKNTEASFAELVRLALFRREEVVAF